MFKHVTVGPQSILTTKQLVVSIMIGSLIINRHRTFSIFPTRPLPNRSSSSDDLLANVDRDSSDDESGLELRGEKMARLGEQQKFCGIPLGRLDTSRFSGHLHSRIIQKFPFLVEMFYWALNYVAYSLTKKTGTWMYERQGGHQVTELAQKHAIDILYVEHESFLRFFFPFSEVGVQRFFLENHQGLITAFNQLYSLVHIPGTVAYASPNPLPNSPLTAVSASCHGTTTSRRTTTPSPSCAAP